MEVSSCKRGHISFLQVVYSHSTIGGSNNDKNYISGGHGGNRYVEILIIYSRELVEDVISGGL